GTAMLTKPGGGAAEGGGSSILSGMGLTLHWAPAPIDPTGGGFRQWSGGSRSLNHGFICSGDDRTHACPRQGSIRRRSRTRAGLTVEMVKRTFLLVAAGAAVLLSACASFQASETERASAARANPAAAQQQLVDR